MAVRIPTSADLGTVLPRAVGGLPQYPAEDPGAAATVAFGKGVSAFGGALLDIDDSRQRLNESNATLDLVNRLVPLHTQIQTETDPNKIAELRSQYNSLLQTSANAIDDPARRQRWMASHAKTILQANADADKRLTLLDRENVGNTLRTQIDTASRNGALSDDPAAVEGTRTAINNVLGYGRKYGAITADQEYAWRKQADAQLVAGTVRRLMNQGRNEEALRTLDQNPTALDPSAHEALRNRIETGRNKNQGLRAVDEALGLVSPMPRQSGGMEVGGAIAGRIAQEAARNNIAPTDALATAQIESAMGRNLGTRGNIFQLGKTEWSAVGGGRMGEPDTDIRNGLAWMGKVKGELGESLGREPQGWEIYLAHQQGVAGATKLLNNPNTPAGELLPPRHISANGGDPSAPASAFVSKWRATFQRTAANIGGGGAASSAGAMEVWGDSLGVGLKSALKAPGQATGGLPPTDILAKIKAQPEASWVGKTVVLSSGSNGNQMPAVEETISFLKGKGANVVAVGYGPKFPEKNAQLADIASRLGVQLVPAEGVDPAEGIHPGPQGYARMARNIAQVARQPVASPGSGSSIEPGLQAEIDAAPQAGQPIPLDDIGTALVPAPPTLPGGAPIPPRIVPAPSYFQARDAIMRNPNLNAESREYALDQLAHRFTRDSAVIRDLETRAKESLANQQKAVASSLLGRVIRGEQLDSQMLAGLVETQQLTDDQYRALRVEAAREVTQDDIPTYSAFSRRAYAGEDISTDLWKAVANKQLKGATAESLQRTANARRERGEDQVERAAYATLRTAAGMDAQERPMVDLDKSATANQMQLWSLAQQEWNRRVLIGRQDPTTGQMVREEPNAVLVDMLPRYGRPIERVEAFPKPRMGAVTKLEELPSVIEKTYEVHARGGMTDAQLAEEELLLDRLRAILEAQKKRADAAATAPKTGTPDNAARGRVKAQ